MTYHVPDPLPGQMTLKPSPKKWIAVIVIGAIFTAMGGLLMATGDMWVGLVALLFFGAVMLTGAYQLFGGRSYLSLTQETFEQSIMGRKTVWRWDECSDFAVWGVFQGIHSMNDMVVFDHKDDDTKKLTAANRSLAGAGSALGDTFGMKAPHLAALMNAYRIQAIAARPDD